MTIDRLRDLVKNYVQFRQKMIPIVLLLGIAVLSGVATLAKATGYFLASSKAERIVTQAIARSKPNPKVIESQVAKARPIADDLKKENLFAPPPPREHPIKSVLGIFGDEAFINGKWYKAGAKVGDAKIVAIGPSSVTTEWDGKTKIFLPIDAVETPAPGGPGSRPDRSGPRPGRTPGESPDMVVVQSEGPRRGPERGPGGPGGFGGPGGPEGMRGRFSQMSEAERDRIRAQMQQARERYSQMSEAERERFRAEMRERFGGGRDGGRDSRGDRGGRR